ncbi:MAG: hypothetical protein RIR96_1504 [Bacteroidota bacterium]|jgi:hypothetical protein
MKSFLLVLAIGVALSSCNSTLTKTLSSPTYAPKLEINPIRADLEIDMNKKLNGEAKASYFLMFKVSKSDNKYVEGLTFTSEGISISDLVYTFWGLQFLNPNNKIAKTKASAAYNAILGSGADVLVHPSYTVEKHNYIFFSFYKINVTGYAGYFKKFYQEPYKDNKTHHIDGISVELPLIDASRIIH